MRIESTSSAGLVLECLEDNYLIIANGFQETDLPTQVFGGDPDCRQVGGDAAVTTLDR